MRLYSFSTELMSEKSIYNSTELISSRQVKDVPHLYHQQMDLNNRIWCALLETLKSKLSLYEPPINAKYKGPI